MDRRKSPQSTKGTIPSGPSSALNQTPFILTRLSQVTRVIMAVVKEQTLEQIMEKFLPHSPAPASVGVVEWDYAKGGQRDGSWHLRGSAK